MTREKAIEMIRNDMELNGCTWSIEETEAVKMAIEALEQPERMKLVQEAVNTLMSTSKTNSIKDKCFRNAARFVQNAIDGEPQDFEQIPQPKQKTGRWIQISPAGIYECSECGKNVMTNDIEEYKWCHGCGCKMEEQG